jgi:SNF2 family DNA or RNA helicase
MSTASPDNTRIMDDVQTNKQELPRTVSLSSTESSEEKKDEDEVISVTENVKTSNPVNNMYTDALTTSDNKEVLVRRSRREKKSTLVYIDGQAVLAKNNYQMKGFAYEYGTTDHQTAPPEKKPRANATCTLALLSKAAAAPKPIRTTTELETKRKNHNAAVKHRVERKQHRLSQYLALHVSELEPFLDKSVTAQLKQVFNDSSSPPLESEELFMQPSVIQADMRDYQLQGLNWMVKMYNSNLSMILGDEMGLVRGNASVKSEHVWKRVLASLDSV